MGLIARTLEAAGITTVSLSGARSITAAANPPRAVFLDYPLGQTAGRAGNPEKQDFVMRSALNAVEKMNQPGAIETINLQWSDDDSWKDGVMRINPTVMSPPSMIAPNATQHPSTSIRKMPWPQQPIAKVVCSSRNLVKPKASQKIRQRSRAKIPGTPTYPPTSACNPKALAESAVLAEKDTHLGHQRLPQGLG